MCAQHLPRLSFKHTINIYKLHFNLKAVWNFLGGARLSLVSSGSKIKSWTESQIFHASNQQLALLSSSASILEPKCLYSKSLLAHCVWCLTKNLLPAIGGGWPLELPALPATEPRRYTLPLQNEGSNLEDRGTGPS